VRGTLRRNKVAHLDFNPSLENLKSRLLLDGVYKPNIVSTEADSSKLATEFIKESKNFRCENFTISDIYGAAMKEQLLKKQLAYEKKLLSMVKSLTDEEREERKNFLEVIKANSIRNIRDAEDNPKSDKQSELEVARAKVKNELGSVKLTGPQMKAIYRLMDRREKATSKKDLPLSSYVKQLEDMLEEGYEVEYVDPLKLSKLEKVDPDKVMASDSYQHISETLSKYL